MKPPKNVVPLQRTETRDGDAPPPANVLGILHRKDFELWVCRSPRGVLTLKWWRWRDDLERFFPLEDGEFTLDPSELEPLAELLLSVDKCLALRRPGPGREGR